MKNLIQSRCPGSVVLAVAMAISCVAIPFAQAAGAPQSGSAVTDKCRLFGFLSCNVRNSCQCQALYEGCSRIKVAPERIAAWKKDCAERGIAAAAPEPAGGNQCMQLQDTARLKSEELFQARTRWDAIEDEYLAFYDASKMYMQADFDKVYYELPAQIPFSGSLNVLVKVETNQRLRHMPSIKIRIVPEALGKFQDFLTVANDLSGVVPGASLLSEAGTVSSWLGFWAGGKLEVELPYDEGVAKYRQLMSQRQTTLDNYRRFINLFFCKKLVKLEHEIYTLRTVTVPRSQCAANEKEAMDGWLARHTKFNNPVRLKSMDNYCAAF